MNKVIFTGRLTGDPEIKYSQSGKVVCKVNIAVKRDFKENGEYKSDFFQLTAFEKRAETIGEYMRKGQLHGFVCRVQNHEYKDDDEKTVKKNQFLIQEIEFLESGKKKDKGNLTDGAETVTEDDNSEFPF